MQKPDFLDDKPKVLDLFCGAGGLSLGFENAGFQILCAVENHSDPIKTYINNRLENQNKLNLLIEDIRNIKKSNIDKAIAKSFKKKPKIDVVIGGSPCQGFSLRGKREINDPRNNLAFEFFRIVDEIKPEIFVFENVSGLLMKNNRAFLFSIIKRIEKLKYHIGIDVLNSSDYGVPQNRKRLIIIGSKNINSVFFPKKSNYEELQQIIEKLELKPPNYDVVPVVKNRVSIYDALDDIAYGKVKESPIKYRKKATSIYQKFMRKNSEKLFNHITTKHRENSLKMFSMLKPGQGIEDLPMNLRVNRRSLQRMERNKQSRTITCCNEDFIHYSLDRIITIREMARLQSFPDNYIFYGTRTTGGDMRKFSCCQVQQAGNSVPPLLAQAIAEGVLKMLEYKSNSELIDFINSLNKKAL